MRERRWLVTIGAAALAYMVLLLHARHYWPYVADDAFISLRYALRLLQGRGLTWTDGTPPVEGYSNLLWVLAAAALGACGLDLFFAIRLLGFVCMATVPVALAYPHRGIGTLSLIPCIVAPLSFACATPAAVWTIGGLEQPLLAALLAWSCILLFRIVESENIAWSHTTMLGLLLGLIVLTRPDGALFTPCVILGIVLARGIDRSVVRTSLTIALIAATFYTGQLAFRLVYYSEWVPNTALVKISPSWQYALYGAQYVLLGLLSLGPLSAFAVLLALLVVLDRSVNNTYRRKCVLAVLPALVVWLLYIAFVGGDVFASYRHLVVSAVLLGLIVRQGLEYLLARWRGPAAKWTTAAIAAVSLVAMLAIQPHFDRNRIALSERWELGAISVGKMLKQGFGEAQPLLAIGAAGAVPFYSELPAVDMLGLNDYYLPRHKPADFGKGFYGHELSDPDYVLGRKPDLVFITNGTFGDLQAEKDLLAKPEFAQLYSLIQLRAPALDANVPVWIRNDSAKIGIAKTDDGISVPSYYFSGPSEFDAARPGPSGGFVMPVWPNRPLTLKGLKLDAGRWRTEAVATKPLGIIVAASATSATIVDAELPVELELERESVVDLTVKSISDGKTEFQKMTFVRLDPSGQAP